MKRVRPACCERRPIHLVALAHLARELGVSREFLAGAASIRPIVSASPGLLGFAVAKLAGCLADELWWRKTVNNRGKVS
jgi:hypothetical protein